MSISSAPIAAAPISGEKASGINCAFAMPWSDATVVRLALTCRWFLETSSGMVVSQTAMLWSFPEITRQWAFPFEQAFIRVQLECHYGNEPMAVQWELPFSEIFPVDAAVEFPWEPLPVIHRQWTEEYGTLFVQSGAEMPFGNAPVTAQCEYPISAPIETLMAFPWTILGVAGVQIDIPWSFTTPVNGATAFPFDLLVRTPVQRMLVEYWDLSEDRPFLQPNSVVRVFHQGVLL